MDFYEAIRLQALRDVLSPDQDYLLRKIHRWYSKTFSTPLAEAYEVPLEDVLQAWFEERYEAMSQEDLEEERQELLETPEQRQARLARADAEQAEADEYAKLVEIEEQEKAKKKKKAKAAKPAAPTPIIPNLGKGRAIVQETELPDLPPLREIPPDITMKFVDPDTFENELEGFGSMVQPPKVKK